MLEHIATELQWPSQHARVVAAARGIYRGQPAGVPTWSGYERSERLDISFPPWWVSAAETVGVEAAFPRPDRVVVPGIAQCRDVAGAWRAARPAVAHRGLRLIMAALGPADAVTSASINAAITCRPAPTANASRPSLMFSTISLDRRTDPLGHRGCAHLDGLNPVTLLHGGPLAVGVLGGTPDTYDTAGLERGTARPQLLREPGQPR